MPLTLVFILAPLLLILLLVFEKRDSLGGKLAVKPVLSCLFVLTALGAATHFSETFEKPPAFLILYFRENYFRRIQRIRPKNWSKLVDLSRLFPHYEPIGIHNRLDS